MKKNCLIMLFILTLFSISFISCSKDLSRGKAEDLIIQKLNLPQPETTQIAEAYVEGEVPWNLTRISPEEENMLNYYSSKGLITLQKIPHTTEIKGLLGESIGLSQNWNTIKVELTNEGRQYLIGQNNEKYIVKVCDIVFGEITGVRTQEQFKVSEVSYTLKREKATPFALNISQEPIKRTAMFSLYDDGWRMQ